MIPRLHKRGTSFKGACRYILHDAGQETSDRVLWTETRNILSAPEDAWAEMFATARDQATIKQQAGRDARGRKNTKPVLHYTLSWAETDRPSAEHMRETTLASLQALGLDRHQVLMAAHSDKAHLHVHIVVNTIHPETGLTAPLKYSKEALSQWAEAYEKEHGIHCQQRVRNNEERNQAREMSQAAALLSVGDCLQPKDQQPTPYVPVKHRGQHRQRWYERQDILDRMKRMRAEMDVGHKVVRNATWERQKQERDLLHQDCKAACHQAREYVEQMYRPRWRDLYREQKRECRELERKATHPFERAVFVFRNRERLGHGKLLTFRQMCRLILNHGKLLDRVDAVHEKERRALAQAEKAEKAVMTEPILVKHQVRFDQLRSSQEMERSAEREAQFARSRTITFVHAKASLRAEPFIHDTYRGVFKRDQDTRLPPGNDPARAEEIKRHLLEWRKRHPDRDFSNEN